MFRRKSSSSGEPPINVENPGPLETVDPAQQPHGLARTSISKSIGRLGRHSTSKPVAQTLSENEKTFSDVLNHHIEQLLLLQEENATLRRQLAGRPAHLDVNAPLGAVSEGSNEGGSNLSSPSTQGQISPNTHLHQENDTLKSQLAVAEKQIGIFRSRIDARDQELAALRKSIAGGSAPPPPPQLDDEESSKLIASLSAQLEESLSYTELLLNQVSVAERDKAAVDAELATVRQERDTLQAQVSSSSFRVGVVDQENASLSEKTRALDREIHDLREQLAVLGGLQLVSVQQAAALASASSSASPHNTSDTMSPSDIFSPTRPDRGSPNESIALETSPSPTPSPLFAARSPPRSGPETAPPRHPAPRTVGELAVAYTEEKRAADALRAQVADLRAQHEPSRELTFAEYDAIHPAAAASSPASSSSRSAALAERDATIARLEGELAQVREILADDSGTLNELEGLRRKFSSMTRSLSITRHELEGSATELHAHDAKLADALQQRDSLQTELQAARKQVEQLKAQLSEAVAASKEIGARKDQTIAARNEQLAAKTRQLEEAKEKERTLTNRLETLHAEVRAKDVTIAEQNDLIESKARRVEEADELRRALESHIDSLQDELKKKEQEILEQSQSLASRERQLHTLEAETLKASTPSSSSPAAASAVSDMTSQVAKLEAKNVALEDRVAELTRRLTEVEREELTSEAEVAKLRQANKDMQRALNDVETVMERKLHAAEDEMRRAVEAAEASKSNVEDELAKLKKRTDEERAMLQDALKSADADRTQLVTELQLAKALSGSSTTDDARRAMSAAEAEMNRMTTDLQHAMALAEEEQLKTIDALQKALEDKTREAEDKATALSEKSSSLASAERRADEMKGRADALHNELIQVRQQLAATERELASRPMRAAGATPSTPPTNLLDMDLPTASPPRTAAEAFTSPSRDPIIDVPTLRRELMAKTEALDSLSRRLAMTDQELARRDKTIAEMQREIENMLHTAKGSRAHDADVLRVRVETLETLLNERDREIDKQRRSITEGNGVISDLESLVYLKEETVNSLRKETEQLKSEVASANAKLQQEQAAFKSSKAPRDQEMQALLQRIESLETQLAREKKAREAAEQGRQLVQLGAQAGKVKADADASTRLVHELEAALKAVTAERDAALRASKAIASPSLPPRASPAPAPAPVGSVARPSSTSAAARRSRSASPGAGPSQPPRQDHVTRSFKAGGGGHDEEGSDDELRWSPTDAKRLLATRVASSPSQSGPTDEQVAKLLAPIVPIAFTGTETSAVLVASLRQRESQIDSLQQALASRATKAKEWKKALGEMEEQVKHLTDLVARTAKASPPRQAAPPPPSPPPRQQQQPPKLPIVPSGASTPRFSENLADKTPEQLLQQISAADHEISTLRHLLSEAADGLSAERVAREQLQQEYTALEAQATAALREADDAAERSVAQLARLREASARIVGLARAAYHLLVRLEDEVADMASMTPEEIRLMLGIPAAMLNGSVTHSTAAAPSSATRGRATQMTSPMRSRANENNTNTPAPGSTRKSMASYVQDFSLRILREVTRNLRAGRRGLGVDLHEVLTDLDDLNLESIAAAMPPMDAADREDGQDAPTRRSAARGLMNEIQAVAVARDQPAAGEEAAPMQPPPPPAAARQPPSRGASPPPRPSSRAMDQVLEAQAEARDAKHLETELNRALGSLANTKQQLDLKSRHFDEFSTEARDCIAKLQSALDSKSRELTEALRALERQQSYIRATREVLERRELEMRAMEDGVVSQLRTQLEEAMASRRQVLAKLEERESDLVKQQSRLDWCTTYIKEMERRLSKTMS